MDQASKNSKNEKDEKFINELSDSILKEDKETVDKLNKIVQKEEEPAYKSLKGPSNNMSKAKKKSRHGRTVTRFCDEANIGQDDELDMAEFILAARYLGNELSEDKLMDVFMDLENADDKKDRNTKEVIKDLLKKADTLYGDDDKKGNDDAHEIMSYNAKASLNEEDDANWQEIQIDGFLTNAKQEQNLQIAKNLLNTTALSANEIAEITGVDAEILRKYEEEFETDDDYDDDDDDGNDDNNNDKQDEKKTNVKNDNNDKDNKSKNDNVNNNKNNNDNAIIIKSTEFGKSLVLTKQDIGSLDELLSGGVDSITKKPKLCLQLLQKMKKGIDLTPGADKRSKHLKKLKTMVQMDIKNAADKIVNDKKKKDSKKEETKKKAKFPAKYRIVIVPGALVKSSKELASKEVAKLPIGTVVVVSEIDGRRAKITAPVTGWCSLSSKDGRVICQRENTKSKEMEGAIHAERARQTKILILKSITTLNDATVQRILERSDWNLRRGIEAFYLAKYKTQEYIKSQDDNNKKGDKSKDKKPSKKDNNKNKNTLAVSNNKKSKKKGWWKSWKKFANQ